MASALRQRAYYVNMDKTESVIWNREQSCSWLDSGGLFGDLAWVAGADKSCYVFTHSWLIVLSCGSLD